jgi:hypothetical protein
LRGRFKVIAIKQSFDLVPWADVVYGCDPAWWRHRKGLPEYNGLKLAWAGANLDYPGVKPVQIVKDGRGKYRDELQAGPLYTVGGGGNSGFQALNLAVQFGATRILLVGYDMTDASGVHWYGRNDWPMANNPNQSNFKRWTAAFDSAAPVLKGWGVEVIHCSLHSALECFPKKSIEDVVQGLS